MNVIVPGYICPDTRWVAISVTEFYDYPYSPDMYSYLFNERTEQDGLDPWRTIESIDKAIDGSEYDLWFNDGYRPHPVSGDTVIFIRQRDHDKIKAHESQSHCQDGAA